MTLFLMIYYLPMALASLHHAQHFFLWICSPYHPLGHRTALRCFTFLARVQNLFDAQLPTTYSDPLLKVTAKGFQTYSGSYKLINV